MTKINQAKLYSTQISLSEWFERIAHKDSEKLRQEDNDKRDRLELLNEIIELPFDKQVKFKATDLSNKTPEFLKYLDEHGKELCALRLIPNDPKLPKLRTRGDTVLDSFKWFAEQKINYEDYRAEFIPHSEPQLWSTIFIVTLGGIFGEITRGGHYQLTQGFYDEGEPISFYYDFKHWTISHSDPKIEEYLKGVISKIKVLDIKDREVLVEKLDVKFSNYYLQGYFETVDTKDFGLWFVDYNRILSEMYSGFIPQNQPIEGNFLSGKVGSSGKAIGKVKIILSKNLNGQILGGNEILVTDMTTPNFLPLMKLASAIITDFGGILSHAAIVARELKIPCITSTKNATEVLKDGDLIEVDADLGIIKYVS